MRFILGVMSALVLLGAGAIATSIATTTGYQPILAAITGTPAPAPATPAPVVTKAATVGELDDVQPILSRDPDPVPVEAATVAVAPATPLNGDAPEIAAPVGFAPLKPALVAEIQAAPQLQSVTFLAAVDAASPLPPAADTTPADPIEVLYVTGGRVNMRSGPGSRYKRVATMERGSQMMVVEKGDRWHKVSGIVDGTVVRGWMAGSFLSPEPIQIEAANAGN